MTEFLRAAISDSTPREHSSPVHQKRGREGERERERQSEGGRVHGPLCLGEEEEGRVHA